MAKNCGEGTMNFIVSHIYDILRFKKNSGRVDFHGDPACLCPEDLRRGQRVVSRRTAGQRRKVRLSGYVNGFEHQARRRTVETQFTGRGIQQCGKRFKTSPFKGYH